MSTNTSNSQQEANFLEEDDDAGSDEEANNQTIPESHEQDTGTHYDSPPKHKSQPHDELDTIPEEEEEPQMKEQPDLTDQDTLVFTPEESKEEPFNTAIDNNDDSTIVIGKPVTTAFISHQVCIPTEKVGYLQVTSQLQEFLNHFPQKSIEKAFEQIYQIYQILQVLDKYLIDNLQQHQYCMSPDSEYITLISYSIKLEINLCNFPAIWAVLYPLRH